MTNNKKFVNLAIIEANKSYHRNFRHGAILVKGNKVVSTGYNAATCNNQIFKSTHAEMKTIINAKKSNKNIFDKACVLYVVRINNAGTLASSKPCIHCMNIIKKHNIKNVIYSKSDSELECIQL